MSIPDLIGVRQFNVSRTDSINDPVLRLKIIQRLNTLEREAHHTLLAVAAFGAELGKERPFPSPSLPHTLKRLRDWVLSQVMSASYVTSMCADFVLLPDPPTPEILYVRAFQEGVKEAVADPDRKAWLHKRYSGASATGP
jgi:hypothetical protein